VAEEQEFKAQEQKNRALVVLAEAEVPKAMAEAFRNGNLGIMDATAFALCRDQKLPITVFSIFKHGALKRVVMGEDEGTLVFAS